MRRKFKLLPYSTPAATPGPWAASEKFVLTDVGENLDDLYEECRLYCERFGVAREGSH